MPQRSSDPTTAVVVAGGDPLDPRLGGVAPPGAPVVAADSGNDRAVEIGLTPALVVGDLDSADADGLRVARRAGVTIQLHPTDKDATDLELAVSAALDRYRPDRLVVLGGAGGRADLALTFPLLLAGPLLGDLAVEAWWGRAHLQVARPAAPVELHGRPGSLVSILPVHGPALRVHTSGLRWPLAGEDLLPGTTRGISNELVSAVGEVALEGGVALVIRPDAVDDLPPRPAAGPPDGDPQSPEVSP